MADSSTPQNKTADKSLPLQTAVLTERVRRATKREINDKNSWVNTSSLLISHRRGRGDSAGKPLFTYSVEVPSPLEGKSLFETHCSLVYNTSGTQTEYVCVCVWTHTWTFPTQNFAKHVCTSWEEGIREGGWGRNLTRYWRDGERERKREKEGGGGAKRGKKDFLTLQLLLRQPAWQYIQPLPQWHEGIRWINPLLFPLQKHALAMWKPHRPSPLFCFQPGHSLPLALHSLKKKKKRDKNDPVSSNWDHMNFV